MQLDVVTLFLLFAELIKATYTSTSSLVDHGLSMVVFIACLVEFLLAPLAATSTFFLVMVATAIDVTARTQVVLPFSASCGAVQRWVRHAALTTATSWWRGTT
mgnify:CR=1 FL=1